MAAVFVSAPCLGLSQCSVCGCSVAGDVLERVTRDTGLLDLYLVCNGRLVDREEQLQNGAVYRLEPRLRGGKGGFGSMLRALGAQIEKTTNREACRDLSGRRLRDVNHEKEMAEWLKKQSEREAEKEQRRLERLQKKLAEPKHQFIDTEYQRQCHDLSERLEDSVLKGLQVSSSSQVKAEVSKRPSGEQSEAPEPKKSRGAAILWTGLDDLLSSDEDLDQDEDESVTTVTQSRGAEPAVSMVTQSRGEEPCRSSSSSPESEDRPGPSSSPESEDRPGPSSSPESEDRPGPSSSPESEDQPGPSFRTEETSSNQTNSKPAETSSRPEDPDQDSPLEQRPLLDLTSVSSLKELEALGLNVLKEELLRRGLKCGGTISERAARLFSVRGKRNIDPTLLAKKPDKKQKK